MYKYCNNVNNNYLKIYMLFFNFELNFAIINYLIAIISYAII